MLLYSMWATQYTPNNDNVQVPGVLSDGRTFTDYSIDSTRNEQIKRENHITNNEEYRRFLVQNTDKIMKYNYDQMKLYHQSEDHESIRSTPYLYDTIQDDAKPMGYEDSFPKQNFLTRQQIDDKKRRLLKEDY